MLSDSLQTKLMLKNIIANNIECNGVLNVVSCYCISFIIKATKKSKYLYGLLAYDENHVRLIQHTKNYH